MVTALGVLPIRNGLIHEISYGNMVEKNLYFSLICLAIVNLNTIMEQQQHDYYLIVRVDLRLEKD